GGPGGHEMDPDAPSPMQQQKREHLASLYPGTMEDRQDKFAADVRRWSGADHAIYLVGPETEVRRMLGDAARSKDISIVKRVSLPQQPLADRNNGAFGGGGGGGVRRFAAAGGMRGMRGGGPGGFAGPFAGAGGGAGGGGGPAGGGGPMGMGLGDAREIVIA